MTCLTYTNARISLSPVDIKAISHSNYVLYTQMPTKGRVYDHMKQTTNETYILTPTHF